jgi:ribosome-binding protein aMBF1 (putative translation factor)
VEAKRCYAKTNKGSRCSRPGEEWVLVRGGVAAWVCHQHKGRHVQLADRDADINHISDALSETVRELRDIRGWTQRETAKRAGVGRNVIQRLENGYGATTMKPLCKIASAFGVKAWKLLKDAGL